MSTKKELRNALLWSTYPRSTEQGRRRSGERAGRCAGSLFRTREKLYDRRQAKLQRLRNTTLLPKIPASAVR